MEHDSWLLWPSWDRFHHRKEILVQLDWNDRWPVKKSVDGLLEELSGSY